MYFGLDQHGSMPREARVVVVAPKCTQAPGDERHDQFEIAFRAEFALNEDWVTRYPVDVSSICGERKRPVPAKQRSGVTPKIDQPAAGTGDYLQVARGAKITLDQSNGIHHP